MASEKQFVGDEQIGMFGRLAFQNKVVGICLLRVQQLAVLALLRLKIWK